MIIKAHIYEQQSQFGETYFLGECEAITICTNVQELKGQLVEFLGDTRDQVINQIIAVLKSKGMSGKLRII